MEAEGADDWEQEGDGITYAQLLLRGLPLSMSDLLLLVCAFSASAANASAAMDALAMCVTHCRCATGFASLPWVEGRRWCAGRCCTQAPFTKCSR